MPIARSLDLWQEGALDPQSGLPLRRSTVIPDEYAAFAKEKRRPLGQLGTFLERVKTNFRSRRRQSNITSSEQTSEQHSSFRRSMITSARLEKEHTRYKAPNKLTNVLGSSPVPEQIVWRKELSPLTEGHPILRANPDMYIPSEYDSTIHWALDQIFSPYDSQISSISSFGQRDWRMHGSKTWRGQWQENGVNRRQ